MKFLISLSLILSIWLLCLTSSTSADCCKPTYIEFEVAINGNREDCSTFGAYSVGHNKCQKKICGDGNGVKGTWCGRGRCNPRGCHCKKGCIEGDAVTSFRQKYGFFHFVDVKRV